MSENEIQGTLFGDSLLENEGNLGYGTNVVTSVTGLSTRQISYWVKTGIIEPSFQKGRGSGTKRLFSFKDIIILQVFEELKATGITLQKIRKAKEILEKRGVSDLASVRLCSDGNTVFQVMDDDQLIDIIKQGQGIFTIGLEGIWAKVERELRGFPGQTKDEEFIHPAVTDFLQYQERLSARESARS